MASVADGTQPTCFGMVLVIHCRHILNQQDPLLLLHEAVRLLQVGTHQLFIARLCTLQEAVGRFGACRPPQLLGQRGHRISCQSTGDLDRSLRPSLISQHHRAIGHHCPLPCTSTHLHLHLFLSFLSLFFSLILPSFYKKDVGKRQDKPSPLLWTSFAGCCLVCQDRRSLQKSLAHLFGMGVRTMAPQAALSWLTYHTLIIVISIF